MMIKSSRLLSNRLNTKVASRLWRSLSARTCATLLRHEEWVWKALVFVSFVIDKQGAISDVQVVKGISADCDKEAVRVVKHDASLEAR